MLAKKYRLSRDKDFDRVWQSKKSVYLKLIGVKITKNTAENKRFGIIVSTKISKKAVIRNKIKRIIKAVIAKELNQLKSGYDVVIIAQKQIVTADSSDIEQELIKIFKKLKIYQ